MVNIDVKQLTLVSRVPKAHQLQRAQYKFFEVLVRGYEKGDGKEESMHSKSRITVNIFAPIV